MLFERPSLKESFTISPLFRLCEPTERTMGKSSSVAKLFSTNIESNSPASVLAGLHSNVLSLPEWAPIVDSG